jgi:DinB superfamily
MQGNIFRNIKNELSRNKEIFKSLLNDITRDDFLWKQEPGKWCLLEIVCHLYDEECEDFPKRLKSVLEDPEKPFSSIDPVGWVKERDYINQNFDKKLESFLTERDRSLVWLNKLTSPKWDNAYQHPSIGPMSAKMILSNWLAHDYLHIRQIVKLKYDYLKYSSEQRLDYAGDW